MLRYIYIFFLLEMMFIHNLQMSQRYIIKTYIRFTVRLTE